MRFARKWIFGFSVPLIVSFVMSLPLFIETTSSQQCCNLPTSESTSYVGPFHITKGLFAQDISDPANLTYNGHRVTESPGSTPVHNGCDWGGWPFPAPSLSGGTWTVGTGQVGTIRNRWGWDIIGYEPEVIDAIRSHGYQEGLMFPCEVRVYQNMAIECNPGAGDYQVYMTNIVLATVISDVAYVSNCRAGVCGGIEY